MRGGYLHNCVLIDTLEEEFLSIGATTQREVHVSDEDKTGWLDMLIHFESHRIGVEAELTAKRVPNDLWKASVLGVDELWIVTPNVRVSRCVARALGRLSVSENQTQIFVLTLGQARQRVRNKFPLISGPNAPGKTEKQKRRKSDES